MIETPAEASQGYSRIKEDLHMIMQIMWYMHIL